MAYANGQIPLSALTALSTGGHMLAPAAAAFETWRIQARAAGYDMRPTTVGDAYRNLDRQINVFKQRYEPRAYPYVGPYNDVRYWNGVRYVRMRGAAAAVPGTSNHGKGLAVDIKNAGPFGGAYHAWMSRTGPKLGFTNVEGRSVNEPWHWVHSGAWVVNNPITGGGSGSLPNPGGNLPDPLTPLEEDDEMIILARTSKDATVWCSNGVARWKVPNLNTLKTYQWLIDQGFYKAKSSAVQTIDDIWALGYPIDTVTEQTLTAVAGVPAKVWATTVDRGGKKIPALQELADAKTAAQKPAAEVSMDVTELAEAIVARLPEQDAQAVADAVSNTLANRLKG